MLSVFNGYWAWAYVWLFNSILISFEQSRSKYFSRYSRIKSTWPYNTNHQWCLLNAGRSHVEKYLIYSWFWVKMTCLNHLICQRPSSRTVKGIKSNFLSNEGSHAYVWTIFEKTRIWTRHSVAAFGKKRVARQKIGHWPKKLEWQLLSYRSYSTDEKPEILPHPSVNLTCYYLEIWYFMFVAWIGGSFSLLGLRSSASARLPSLCGVTSPIWFLLRCCCHTLRCCCILDKDEHGFILMRKQAFNSRDRWIVIGIIASK